MNHSDEQFSFQPQRRVYLDYAATAPLCAEAKDAMEEAFRVFGNPDSLHGHGRAAADVVTRSRDSIAETLGVDPSEVYFTAGGTESNNWAVRCLGAGKAVLSPIEHASALEAAKLREGGFALAGVGTDGVVRRAHLEPFIDDTVGLVAVMAVNNETGCIQPMSEIADLAHRHGALLFSDCVQAACTQDLKEIARIADALSLSAHKLGGPAGAGALIVKRGVPLRPLLCGGEQERGLRAGTLNAAGIAGFARAFALAQRAREAFCAHTAACKNRFREALSRFPNAYSIDGENCAPNILHFTHRLKLPLLTCLDLGGVEGSGGAACSAHAALPSHVMRAMGRSEDDARRGIRLSFGMQTSEEDVDYALALLEKYANGAQND